MGRGLAHDNHHGRYYQRVPSWVFSEPQVPLCKGTRPSRPLYKNCPGSDGFIPVVSGRPSSAGALEVSRSLSCAVSLRALLCPSKVIFRVATDNDTHTSKIQTAETGGSEFNVDTFNPSPQADQAGGAMRVWSQAGLHSETLSQKPYRTWPFL